MSLLILFQGISALTLVLFAAGVLFFLVEMIEPGLSVFWILGTVCWTAAVIVTARTLAEGLLLAAGELVLLLILLILFLQLFGKGKAGKRLILPESTSAEEGFSGTEDYSELVGQTGRALTALRPSGSALFGEKKVDVVTRGEYIEPDTDVVVLSTEGARILVTAPDVHPLYIHSR